MMSSFETINDMSDTEDSDNDLMSAVIDEISLEGLDGITLPSLWVRLSVRFEQLKGQHNKGLDLTSISLQNYIFYQIIKDLTNDKTLSMFKLPENRPTIQIYNRYDFVNEETGTLLEDTDLVPDDVYGEVKPISDQKVKGSSRFYYERTNVTKAVINNNLTLIDIQNNYGLEKFVLVADQSHRTLALLGPYSQPDIDLSPVHYSILERIGRQRYLGEITIGKEAGNYNLTAKTLFYYRKLLLKKKLIKKKQCIIFNKKTVQNSHGLVFTLMRFSTEKQTITEINAKKINDLLVNSMDKELDYEEVKSHLDIKAKYLRELLHNYSSNFRVCELPQESSSSSNKSNSYKRCIKLLKPIGEELDETELNEDNDDDEEVFVGANKSQALNVFNSGQIVADRTLLSQALFTIESHEATEGIPSTEVGRCLSLPKLETRSILRALEKVGAISTVMVDRGRQKVTLYVPKWRTEMNTSAPRRELQGFGGLTETNVNFLKRANIILEFVRNEKLVDRIFCLKQLIRESEKNNEYKVCTKTVVRIVHKLAAEGHVRSIRTFLKYQDRVKKLHFVCVPTITVEHPLVKERINQLKFHWIGNCVDIFSDKRVTYSDDKHKASPEKSKSNVVLNLIYQPSIARKYGLEPKMKKILTLYRFLFYLTHDCSKENIPNTDWRYNIEPLAEGPQTTVCTIGQIMPRMPLSVFVKIVWISHIIPGLQELLDDPVKANLTLSQISPLILDCLRYKRKYVFNICESLVGLNYMGLVETQYKEQTEREKTIITVKNKFSLIVNKFQMDYEINSMKDYQDFEEALQMHCFETCSDCSLDKRLFAHNLRNWTYTPSYKAKGVLASNRLQNIFGNNEPTDNAVDKQKENKKKRKQTSKSKNAKKAKISESNVESVTTETVVNEKQTQSSPQKRKKPRKKSYDKIDLKAKSLLKKQRTDWTPEEDSFLLICKVVSALLDPHCTHHICVNRNVIRDELHNYYPKVSADKTALACGRRITYMLKNPTTRQNVFDYIGDFKQQLTISRPNVPKTQEEVWTNAYVKLLHEILSRMQTSHQKNGENRTAISIHSLEDLFMRFNVVRAPTSVLPLRGRLHEDPNNVVDIHVNVVTNVLLSSLFSKMYLTSNNSKTDNNLFSQTLFRIYQRFPDSLIRSVVTKLNKYGVMTKVKKTTKENLSSLKSKGNTSPYRISQNFLFLMQSKYCLENLLMDSKFDEDLICIKDGKTGLDAAIVTSLLTSKAVRFDTEIPNNIVVMQNDCPLFSSARNSVKNPKDPKTTSRYALHFLRQMMKEKPSDRIQHTADYLNVNQCRITCSATDPFTFDINRFEALFKTQRELFSTEWPSDDNECCSLEDKQLLDYIISKREMGAAVDELSSIIIKGSLNDSLNRLTQRKLVFRVGIRTFRWVSVDYVNPWLVRSQLTPEPNKKVVSNDQNCVKFFARYWKQPNGQIDLRVVFKFLSAVLGHIMTNPCIPELKLIEYFDQSLQPVQLLEIIELLIASQCVDVLESPQVLEPKLFETKTILSNSKTKHYFSTSDCIIRLNRLKEFLKI